MGIELGIKPLANEGLHILASQFNRLSNPTVAECPEPTIPVAKELLTTIVVGG